MILLPLNWAVCNAASHAMAAINRPSSQEFLLRISPELFCEETSRPELVLSKVDVKSR